VSKEKTLPGAIVKISRSAAVLSVTASIVCATLAGAQQPTVSNAARTQAIVATFNKSKHVVREKRGVRKEKYLDVRSEPAIRANAADYSGTYEDAGFGFSVQLRVDAAGKVEGTGREPINEDATVSRTFTLKNGQLRGALLTATRTYADGSSEPFEGVFINKTVFESPTDKGLRAFGLGVVLNGAQVHGITLQRVFLQSTK
jgi:hypothetical protein